MANADFGRRRCGYVVLASLGVALTGATNSLSAQQPQTSGGAPSGPWPREEKRIGDEGGIAGGGGPGADVNLAGSREPCIAVSPTNSLNIAMSSLFQYRVSTNAGAVWTAPASNVVPAGYIQDGDPAMAFDSQGRLFYSYQGFISGSGSDEFVSRLNPTTGALISGPVKVSTSGMTGAHNDKDWIAADRFVGSPFQDRLYLVWTEFLVGDGTRVMTSFSSNQGANWSAPLQVSGAGEGFVWPAHVAAAPNGDVYISYHSQTGLNGMGEAGGNPDGISGKVFVCRSIDGGISFPQKTLAYAAGAADITFNVQTSPGTIPQTIFWLQGSAQAWVLPDPAVPGSVYVVANDDPANAHGSGDDANVYIARSADNGLTWGAPIRVDHGPGTTFAVMPTAAIDDSGCIVAMWYDNRLGATNGAGNFLLDVFYTVSHDHGLTFSADAQLNDVAFNPDLGAPIRFPGPPPTRRIGEYICVTSGGGRLYGVWTGNTATGHQIVFDTVPAICPTCPGTEPCYFVHASAGCSNADCCGIVCNLDPFCCNTSWDSVCVNEALTNCGTCGQPTAGSCLATHPGNGCNNSSCCGSVCALDPFCCDASWDDLCVNEAEDLCGCPADIAPTAIGGDGVVNTADLLLVINSWGPCADCPADVSPAGNNGVVNTGDLLFIINHWGPCPGCGDPFICGEPPGQPACPGGPPCFCWQGYYGDTVCAANAACEGSTLCLDGTCPPGFVCITNTCCNSGAATCLPICGTLLDGRPQAEGLTADGEVWVTRQK